jgi:hypothetical protein
MITSSISYPSFYVIGTNCEIIYPEFVVNLFASATSPIHEIMEYLTASDILVFDSSLKPMPTSQSMLDINAFSVDRRLWRPMG